MNKYGYMAVTAGMALLAVAISPDLQSGLGSWTTKIVKPLLVPIIELINVPAFVYVMATLIFLAGLLACAAYWLRVARPRLQQLRATRVAIFELPLPTPRDDAGKWPEVRRELGDVLRRHSVLVSAWAPFQAASVKSGGIPDEPFGHFADAAPTRSSERSGLMHSLPGYFTSVGLIFTFAGLVVALYFAAKGFRSGDVQEAHASIVRLLNAASFKFLTSVAALVSALIVSLTLRFSLSRIAHDTQTTVELIESLLAAWREKVGPGSGAPRTDAVLVDRVDALVAGLERLTERLDRLLAEGDRAGRGLAYAER